MERRRVKVRVEGRVQGVWYRGSTQERASALDLAGWVRNLPDGAVELEAEGLPAAVDRLIEWCHQGPPAARVTSVNVSEIECESPEPGFEIRR